MENVNQTDGIETPQDPQVSQICGFWRRAGAAAIDSTIFALAESLLKTIFGSNIGGYFNITTLLSMPFLFFYLATFQSYKHNGQTPGMHMLKIQVVDESGKLLPFERAAIRAAVICFAIFPSLMVTWGTMMLSIAGVTIYAFAMMFVIGIVYMAVFNRSNRQSLHDLAAGSFVVHEKSHGPVVGSGISKAH